jgi:hypothetical protein
LPVSDRESPKLNSREKHGGWARAGCAAASTSRAAATNMEVEEAMPSFSAVDLCSG